MGIFLHVDDFGCKPDGRFLERVSINEGESVLRVPDAGLRPDDVGKKIAIPGGADLNCEISKLVDPITVTGAMTTGDRILVATFPPDHDGRFVHKLHQHWRITVAGAGSDGTTLVSDVARVINETTLELADAAVRTVQDAKTIVNDPRRVGLADYARASVSDVTVDLGDRTVHDAAMTIGDNELRSATAEFSSVDVGKRVTIRAAGLHVTTVASYQDSTTVTLTAPAGRTVAGVQTDLWLTDSRPGFESLLACLDNLDVESVEVRFGAGVYDFTRVPAASRMQAGIALEERRNLTVSGTGQGCTILRFMPHQDWEPNAHVVQIRHCARITIRDLSIHGAYLTQRRVNEQMHGIVIDNGSEEIAVQQVRVYQSSGDGIRFLSSEHGRVRRVWIDRCRLVQNKRTGVAFQRLAEQVWVRDCYFEASPPSTDACLDFEPTGLGETNDDSPRDVIVDSNMMVHGTPTIAVSLSGVSGVDRLTRVRFMNNLLLGGSIFSTDVDQLTIRDNTVVVTEQAPDRIPLHIQRGGRETMITGNVLVNNHPQIESALRLSGAGDRPSTRTSISGNLCVTRSGNGIAVHSSSDVAIRANTVVSSGACTEGVFLYAQSSDVTGLSVQDNDITVSDAGTWEKGIRVATGQHHVGDLSIVGNSVHGAVHGIAFDGKGIRQTPMCALNRMSTDVGTPLVGLETLPAQTLIAGGATSQGGPALGTGRHLVGTCDPTQQPPQVAGDIGDLYQRIDNEPGPRLYVKESGIGTTTGWVAVLTSQPAPPS